MSVPPFTVLGLNACFTLGIKIHSFLCQEIQNPIVFLPKLFQDHLFLSPFPLPWGCQAQISISIGPRIWSPQGQHLFWASAGTEHPAAQSRSAARAPFAGTLIKLSGFPSQICCNSPAWRRLCHFNRQGGRELSLSGSQRVHRGRMSQAVPPAMTSSSQDMACFSLRRKAGLIKVNSEV